jgi:hypothetical protein
MKLGITITLRCDAPRVPLVVQSESAGGQGEPEAFEQTAETAEAAQDDEYSTTSREHVDVQSINELDNWGQHVAQRVEQLVNDDVDIGKKILDKTVWVTAKNIIQSHHEVLR